MELKLARKKSAGRMAGRELSPEMLEMVSGGQSKAAKQAPAPTPSPGWGTPPTSPLDNVPAPAPYTPANSNNAPSTGTVPQAGPDNSTPNPPSIPDPTADAPDEIGPVPEMEGPGGGGGDSEFEALGTGYEAHSEDD